MRSLVLLIVVSCASESNSDRSPATRSYSFTAPVCGGSAAGDWRFSARLEEVRAEVVGAHGRWLPCYESRVPDECRGQWDSECLQRVGALNDIDYGLRLRGQWQGNLGHWTVWLYDLREGELVSMEERECARPCTEFRAESTYRDVHRVVLEAIVRD